MYELFVDEKLVTQTRTKDSQRAKTTRVEGPRTRRIWWLLLLRSSILGGIGWINAPTCLETTCPWIKRMVIIQTICWIIFLCAGAKEVKQRTKISKLVPTLRKSFDSLIGSRILMFTPVWFEDVSSGHKSQDRKPYCNPVGTICFPGGLRVDNTYYVKLFYFWKFHALTCSSTSSSRVPGTVVVRYRLQDTTTLLVVLLLAS